MQFLKRAVVLFFIVTGLNVASAEPMSFVVERLPGDRMYVWASGTIEPETADQFRALASEHDFGVGTVVAFDSAGGSLAGALAIGAEIRKRNMSTDISRKSSSGDQLAVCASACVYAFAGGIERTKAPTARIGVHQFFSGSSGEAGLSDAQYVVARLSEFLRAAGISSELLEAASSTAPEEIRWLRDREMSDWKLITRMGNHQFPQWTLASYGTAIQVTSFQPTGHLLSASVGCPLRIKPPDYEERHYGLYSRPSSPEGARFPGYLSLYENYRLDVSLPTPTLPLSLEDRQSIAQFTSASFLGIATDKTEHEIAKLDARVAIFDWSVGRFKGWSSVSLDIDIHETLLPNFVQASNTAESFILRLNTPLFGFLDIALPAEGFAEQLSVLQTSCDLR